MEVFFSYSHQDERLRNELEKHLSLLKRQDVIDLWSDHRIGLGEEFGGEIDQHLESADIILLLVSSDFLNSDYCFDIEMKRAMERHACGEARVIPVILRPCDWHGAPFGKLKAVPTDGTPIVKRATLDDGFVEVAQAVRQTAESLRGHAAEPNADGGVTRAATVAQLCQRSSDLRIRKDFTDHERHTFLPPQKNSWVVSGTGSTPSA